MQGMVRRGPVLIWGSIVTLAIGLALIVFGVTMKASFDESAPRYTEGGFCGDGGRCR